MIRLVHITASLGFGGVERVVTSLCGNMDHQKFEVHIISLSDHIPLAATSLNDTPVKVHTCGRPLNIGSFGLHFPSTFKLYRILNKVKPHIIHTHLYYLNSLAYAMSKGIPHIITLHGPSIIALRNRARQVLFAAANAGSKKRNYSIAVSESLKREIIEKFHSNYSEIEVIHNGIDTDFFRPDPEKHSKKGVPVAINIARHVKGKGIENLLQAWQQVVGKKEARLYLVGDGPQHGEYRQLCETLGISSSVLFLGARSDVRELMHEADFGVFPSETEGMPMAPAEMMAMGLPVIGSDIAPLLELIAPPEGGDTVAVKNFQALAEKISNYLAQPGELVSRGQNARQRIIKHFSLKQQVARHENFYRKILGHA